MTNNLWLTSFPRNEFLLGFGVFLGFVWSESEEPVETGFWLVLVWLKMVWSNPEEPAVFLDPDWSRGISIWSIDDDVIDGSDFRREPPHDGAWGLNRPKSSRSFKSEIRNRSILPICDDVITKMRISDHMIQKSRGLKSCDQKWLRFVMHYPAPNHFRVKVLSTHSNSYAYKMSVDISK